MIVLVLVLLLVLEMPAVRARARVRARVRPWLFVVLIACGGKARTSQPPPHSGNMYRGYASWYGEPQMTASGERFNKHAMTAAHRSLPLGTRVRVTNTRNGKTVVVRINDRGPYSKSRIIDLSEAAAKQLDMIDAGTAPVTLEVLP